jgi:hypothetical protein
MPKTVFDISERFEQLTIIAELPMGPKYQRRYLVRCDCGTEKAVRGMDMRPGKTRSCGCHKRRITLTRSLKHGEGRRGKQTAEYRCWAAMKSRCLNPKNTHFNYYGGRGITISQRWLDSYDAFLSDVGRKPSPAHSIDREDVNGGYFPENCRWATTSEQSQNRRPSQLPRNNTSGFKGVSSRRSKWEANIGVNGRYFYLGHFDTPEAAHHSYVRAEETLR